MTLAGQLYAAHGRAGALRVVRERLHACTRTQTEHVLEAALAELEVMPDNTRSHEEREWRKVWGLT